MYDTCFLLYDNDLLNKFELLTVGLNIKWSGDWVVLGALNKL